MNKLTFFLIIIFVSKSNLYAQDAFTGCPNQGSDVAGHLAWRLKNPNTGAIITTPPQPSTIYQLEIYETPYNSVPPYYRGYDIVGIKGSADGFKLYQNVWSAINWPTSNFSNETIASGVGPDVGPTGGVAVFGIKTLDASDPNWTGQLTAFKAFGKCVPNASVDPNLPSKYFLKTLIIVP